MPITIGVPIAGQLISGLFGASQANRNAKRISDAATSAQHGVLTSGQDASDRVAGAYTNAHDALESSNQVAQGKVNEGTDRANGTLQQGYDAQVGNLNPYLTAGSTGVQKLVDYATTRPAFSFNPSDLENDPGYQFQLGQGTAAVNNSASARGLLQSGNTLQDLTKFGQGLAGTYYNDAFNRALQTFNTNQNSTLANLSTLANIGQTATNQYDQATQFNSGTQAQNTSKAAYFGGTSDLDVSKFLSQLGLSAAQVEGLFGTDAANKAGQFGLTGAGASAAGGQGATNSILGSMKGIFNILGGINKPGSGLGNGPAGAPPEGGDGGYG